MKSVIAFLIFIIIFCSNSFGQAWSAFQNISGTARGFYKENNDSLLYIGGVNSGIAIWDGINVNALSPCPGGAYCIRKYNNELYYGGYFSFTLPNPPTANVARWNGSNWVPLGGGITSNLYDLIIAMEVFNGELYVAGTFLTADGIPVNNIAKWNGTNWSAVGNGLGNSSNSVNNLCVFNNELYATGTFTNSGGLSVNYIAKWNGTSWSSVSGTSGELYGKMIVYNNELYTIASYFSYSTVRKWNGINWYSYPPGNFSGWTFAISQNGEIYVKTVDNLSLHYLSKWDGLNWIVVSPPLNYNVADMIEFQGHIIVGGYFTYAGAIPVNGIAKWGCTLSTNTTMITCPGRCDGTSAALPANGTAPYSYLWALPISQTSQSVDSLCEGNYFLTVTDAEGCIEKRKILVNQIYPLYSYLYSTDPSCYNVCNGIITANIYGGTQPYIYNWSTNSGTAEISDLCSGSYTLTVTDSNSCMISDTIDLLNPDPISIAVFKNETSCDTCNDGSILVFADGGTPPYEYIWQGNNTYNNFIGNIIQGDYTVCIKDFLECDSCFTINIKSAIASQNPSVITVYPNPGNSITFLINKSDQDKIYNFELFNSLGEIVLKILNIQSKSIEISKDVFSNGIYFYKLSHNTLITASGKFVIE